MSAGRAVPVVIVSYDAAFPWHVFAEGALLLSVAFVFRRSRKFLYFFSIWGTALLIGAVLLWAGVF